MTLKNEKKFSVQNKNCVELAWKNSAEYLPMPTKVNRTHVFYTQETAVSSIVNPELESLGIMDNLDTCEDNDIDFVNPIDPDPVPDTTPPGKLSCKGFF